MAAAATVVVISWLSTWLVWSPGPGLCGEELAEGSGARSWNHLQAEKCCALRSSLTTATDCPSQALCPGYFH